jgi:hypothetical protein
MVATTREFVESPNNGLELGVAGEVGEVSAPFQSNCLKLVGGRFGGGFP